MITRHLIKRTHILAQLSVLALLCGCRMEQKIQSQNFSISRTPYGRIGNQTIDQYILKHHGRLEVRLINYGATITDIFAPDRNGVPGNVVLGFDSLGGYLHPDNPYFGATIGRYANRIAQAQFVLDGKTYKLDANNNGNMLHGGFRGFDKVVWQAEVLSDSSIKFSYLSPDGEGGFPGNLNAEVVFSLSSNNELSISFTATTDAPTPVNFTTHSYFNLSAGTDPTILSHELKLFASHYTPVDSQLIPTGKIVEVAGTPFDFTRPKPIGKDLPAVSGGFDHNFVLNRPTSAPALAAELVHPGSGRGLRILTTQPGIQFYSGNFLDGSLTGRAGTRYPRHAGLCLEPQHFPDSPNQPQFPSTILRPGQTYRHTIIYQFFTQ